MTDSPWAYVNVSPLLVTMLRLRDRSGEVPRQELSDAFAAALRIDTEGLRATSRDVLLEVALNCGELDLQRGGWLQLAETGVHRDIVEDALDELDFDDLCCVFDEFGMRELRPPIEVRRPRQAEELIFDRIATWLADRVMKLLVEWSNGDDRSARDAERKQRQREERQRRLGGAGFTARWHDSSQ